MDKSKIKKINKLRKLCDISITKCKYILEKNKYNLEESIEYINKNISKLINRNISKNYNNKESYILLFINKNRNKSIILRINCNTDFVSKNKKFIELIYKIKQVSLFVNSLNELLNFKYNNKYIKDDILKLNLIFNENIYLSNFVLIKSNNILFHYLHHNKKLCSLVEYKFYNNNIYENIIENDKIFKYICIHIASIDYSNINNTTNIYSRLIFNNDINKYIFKYIMSTLCISKNVSLCDYINNYNIKFKINSFFLDKI